MGALEEVGTYLQVMGIGSLSSTIFLGYLPEEPSVCTVIYEYPGPGPGRTFNRTAWENVRLQVVCRDPSYAAADTLATNVWTALDVTEVTLSGRRYQAIHPLQSPFLQNRDPEGRTLIACNYEAERTL